MHASRLSRRAVLAGSAATALTTVALPQGRAHAAEATAATPSYRWRNAVIGGTGFITGVLFHPVVRGLAYARTDIGGAYRWDERAARWTALTDHLGWDDWNLLGVESLAVDPAHPDRPYLALGAYAQSWAGNGAVLRSDDRGATWTRSDLDVKLGANEDGRGAGWASLKDVAVFDVSETPFLDWGDGQPKFGWWIQALALDPYDSKYLVYGTGATLYGTRDLRRWAPRIRGLEEAAVRRLISPPAGEAHLISGLGDIGVMYHERLTASPSRGMATNPVFGSATGLAQAAAKPSYVVRTGWGDHGNGAYSHDGGRTWAPFTAQPDIAKNAPGPIASSADGGTLLWSFVHWDGTKYAAHRSVDNGATWSEVSSFPKGATPVADPADPTLFYAYDTDTGTLYASTDSGRSFTVRAGGLPSGDDQFQLAAAPGRSGDLWLSVKRNGLYRSTDAGVTFAKVASCWASYTLGFGKAADGADHPAVYQVGSTETIPAVHRSDDAAETWVRINDDAHQWGWIGEVITGDPRVYGRVYLGTNGRGIQYGEQV
jgi:hypothetical protein